MKNEVYQITYLNADAHYPVKTTTNLLVKGSKQLKVLKKIKRLNLGSHKSDYKRNELRKTWAPTIVIH